MNFSDFILVKLYFNKRYIYEMNVSLKYMGLNMWKNNGSDIKY